MKNTWWTSGEWNTLCDLCGFKYKSSDLRQRWDGLMVCRKDWETRHPQEMMRPIPDQAKLPWTRPEATDIFVTGSLCTLSGRQAVPDMAVPNCAIPNMDYGVRP